MILPSSVPTYQNFIEMGQELILLTIYLAGIVGSYSRVLGVKAFSTLPGLAGSWFSGSRITVSTALVKNLVSHH